VPTRRLLPAIACLLALTACGSPSASPSPSAALTPATASPSPSASSTVPVQTSLDGITVTGEKGKTPKVTFKPKPFVVDKTQTKVLIQGDGNAILADGIVTINYHGVNGRDAAVFDSSFTRGTPASFPLANVIAGFKTGLTGQKVGSRVLVVIPSSEGYGETGSSDGTIKAGDTLIFVVDILAASATEPSGKTVQPAAGLPTVTGGPADKPTVTMPGTAAPTAMTAQALIEGTGAKVTKDDTIYARFVGYSWKTGKLVHDQWTPISGVLSETIPGWKTGLLDKTVGSRVLLVLPPAFGYPEGANNPPLEKGDTIVYVVDILFAYAG
jgi:peptidylprolyl isomerase